MDTVRREPSLYGCARPRWRLADLRRVVSGLQDYSDSGISRLLRRCRVRLKRGRLTVHSPDPAYDTKLAAIDVARTQARQQPATHALVYVDEFSLYRQPTLARVYAPIGVEPTHRLSYRANTCRRYIGSLDVHSGQVVMAEAARMRIPRICAFLRQLATVYAGRQLSVVWDNWTVHRHPTVLATAAAVDITLLWLPTYAPWTNPIEKLWRWTRQDVVHSHRRADHWEALQHEVRTFFDQFSGGSTALLRYVGLQSD